MRFAVESTTLYGVHGEGASVSLARRTEAVKTYHWGFVLLLAACAAESARGDGESGGSISLTSITATGDTSASDTDPSASGPTEGSATLDDGPDAEGPDDDGTVFDVGADGFCKYKDPGIYCDDTIATECGPGGSEISTDNCAPDICLPGEGCVVCLAGQNTCMGDKVMVCNDAVDPPVWEVAATCNPSAG